MNNLFNRLQSGQNWLDQAYSDEESQAQAKKYALDQVTALQNQADSLLRQKIGDDTVEAAVGAGAIAYPYVKGALGFNSPKGGAGAVDKGSDVIGDMARNVRTGFQRVSQSARDQARAVADTVNKQISQGAEAFNEKAGTLERIQNSIKAKQDAVKNFDPQLADIPEETQSALQTTASRIQALDVPEVAQSFPVPEGVPSAPVARAIPSAAGDLPSVSIPKGEFAARSSQRAALRQRAEEEFGAGEEDAPLKAMPKPPPPAEAGVYDPFSLTPRQVQDPSGGFAGVAGTPEVEEGVDIYDDLASRAKQSAERFNLPTIEDFKRADAAKAAAQEAQRAQTTQPASQPIPDEPDEIQPASRYIPPSQQTGGLDPSKLPEGSGFQRGGAKIPAQRPPAQIQQRGLQQQEFERDPEEDIRTGETIESEAERGVALRETGTGDLLKSAGEEALQPIKLNIPEEDYLPEGFGKAEEAPEEAEGFGEAEEAPDIEEQKEEAVKEEPKPEEPEEDVKGLSEEDLAEEGVEKAGEDVAVEAGAAAVPGIGEAAIAAIGIGQLISGLIDKHKQNEEEASAQAQVMNAPKPSVALDPSVSFDSTFR